MSAAFPACIGKMKRSEHAMDDGNLCRAEKPQQASIIKDAGKAGAAVGARAVLSSEPGSMTLHSCPS